MSSNISIALKGVAMGIAEVIPGVSGGTIAFITGIYERLLKSIKAFGPGLLTTYKESGFKGVWKAIDGVFLASLFAGMAAGFLAGTFVITYILEHYPEPLWGFFFGLIVASAFLIGKNIPKWTAVSVLLFIVGVVVAYGITLISPSEGNTSYPYLFLSGLIAISALMLPGVSGSFILLLMGMYTVLIPMIKSLFTAFSMENLIIVMVFGLGCLTGVATFSRVISWLFDHYKYPTFALLTGFLVGALNKVWPWRNIDTILDKSTGEIVSGIAPDRIKAMADDSYKILVENNVWPQNYTLDDPRTIVTVVAMIIGILSVIVMERKSTKEHS